VLRLDETLPDDELRPEPESEDVVVRAGVEDAAAVDVPVFVSEVVRVRVVVVVGVAVVEVAVVVETLRLEPEPLLVPVRVEDEVVALPSRSLPSRVLPVS
jgi:hypothetical protein